MTSNNFYWEVLQMKTAFEQIVDISKIGHHTDANLNEIINLGARENLSPSTDDKIKCLLLSIDNQFDFHEGGPLGVPGSTEDTERLIRFIYNNINHISCIMSSADAHILQQIFFPCWWINANGEHPDPFTVITYEDVIEKRWSPAIGDFNKSLKYLKGLEEINAAKLCIWFYHCIIGTHGAAIETQLSKMINFHSAARKVYNPLIFKGNDPYSEMYGIIKPEHNPNNFLNMPFLTAIEKHDIILFAGQAASHCFLKSIQQIIDYFSVANPKVIKKLIILEDCTSPIIGYEDFTIKEFDKLKNYGIRFAKSTDDIFG